MTATLPLFSADIHGGMSRLGGDPNRKPPHQPTRRRPTTVKTSIRTAKITHDLLGAAVVFLTALSLSDQIDRAAVLAAATLAVKALARKLVVGEDTPGESA